MAKNQAKSIRMSDEVLEIINKFRGNGFNEKFENIILEAHYSLPKRLEEEKRIDKRIQDKQKQLKEYEDRLRTMDNLFFSLNSLKDKVLQVNKIADSMPTVSHKETPDPGNTGEIEIRKVTRKKAVSQ